MRVRGTLILLWSYECFQKVMVIIENLVQCDDIIKVETHLEFARIRVRLSYGSETGMNKRFKIN